MTLLTKRNYSPTPKIKIEKWYQKICTACVYYSMDYGEYDNIGWAICDENQRLGNMKYFPKCNAKYCKKFNAKDVLNRESDYWLMLNDFDIAFGGNGYKKLHNLLDFNERMGDYKVGRIE